MNVLNLVRIQQAEDILKKHSCKKQIVQQWYPERAEYETEEHEDAEEKGKRTLEVK